MKNLIHYYLPEKKLQNADLAILYKDWTADKIYEKTGIKSRHIASENETVSDMASKACKGLFKEYQLEPADIDFLILVTQSPDYLLPTTACIVHEMIGLRKDVGAFDLNLGCSGYIYSLSLAKSMVKSGLVKNVLLVMSESYSKYINDMDKSTRTLFGDAASASLISEYEADRLGEFVLGTDGSKFDKLIVPASACKIKKSQETSVLITDDSGNSRTQENLFMDGAEIFNFTIKIVPKLVNDVLAKNQLSFDDIDLFVFHQANSFILNYLKKVLKIPDTKFYMNLENVGNTVSATIPIALRMAYNEGRLKKGDKVLLVGFGVGLSWGATVMEW